MHEMSYVVRLRDQALKTAEKSKARSVSDVNISIGEMTGLVPEYMVRYWDEAVKGTLLEGSKLIVNYVNVEIKCKCCEKNYRPSRGNGYKCPYCGAVGGDIIHGREFTIESMTIDV